MDKYDFLVSIHEDICSFAEGDRSNTTDITDYTLKFLTANRFDTKYVENRIGMSKYYDGSPDTFYIFYNPLKQTSADLFEAIRFEIEGKVNTMFIIPGKESLKVATEDVSLLKWLAFQYKSMIHIMGLILHNDPFYTIDQRFVNAYELHKLRIASIAFEYLYVKKILQDGENIKNIIEYSSAISSSVIENIMKLVDDNVTNPESLRIFFHDKFSCNDIVEYDWFKVDKKELLIS